MDLLYEPMTKQLREAIKCRKDVQKKAMVKVTISKEGKRQV